MAAIVADVTTVLTGVLTSITSIFTTITGVDLIMYLLILAVVGVLLAWAIKVIRKFIKKERGF